MRRLPLAVILLGAAICAGPAWADVPKAVIRGDLPAELRTAIERAVGEAEAAPTSRLEARRRAREAAEDAIAVLRSEGYYGHEVQPDIGEGESPEAIVTVAPGPMFRIAEPKLTWITPGPDTDSQSQGEAAMGLKAGDPGRAAAVVGAEGRVVALVQKRGYADAAAAPREVIVDHADRTVRPELRIATGELVRLEGIDLRTEGRTNPEWLRGLTPWKPGDVYDPEAVAELERRLLDAGVYDSVTVALAPKAAADGWRPVLVSLADRPKATLEVGAGYSTSEGLGLDGRRLRYNRFRRADTITTLFRLAQIERRLDVELSLPHWRKPQQTLKTGGGVFQQITDAYEETGVNLRGDLTRRYGKTSYRTVGVSLDFTRTEENLPALQTRDLITLTGLAARFWDRSSDPLDPQSGWRLEVRGEPTVSTGDDTLAYVRLQTQASVYYAIEGGRTVAAARVRVGSALGASLAGLPAARRFYAGGGGSVRGYEYQGVGPRLADDTPRGGLSLFEGSIEVRRKFTDRWGGAAFVDVGSVGDRETPDFEQVSVGVGVGVRYDVGFGPIRADVAFPINRRTGDTGYQIYLSIGQSF